MNPRKVQIFGAVPDTPGQIYHQGRAPVARYQREQGSDPCQVINLPLSSIVGILCPGGSAFICRKDTA